MLLDMWSAVSAQWWAEKQAAVGLTGQVADEAPVGVMVSGGGGVGRKQAGACGGHGEWCWWWEWGWGRQAGVSAALQRCAGEVLVCQEAPYAFSLSCMQSVEDFLVMARGLC